MATNSAGALTLTTESGSQGVAKIIDGIISVPSWNVSGRLSENGLYIQWSNGFTWERYDSSKLTVSRKSKKVKARDELLVINKRG